MKILILSFFCFFPQLHLQLLIMILDAVYLCYDPSHQPFANDGAVKIENLQSDRPASKIIRAVIRDVGIDATSWESYSLHRCYCKSKGKGSQEIDDSIDPRLTLDELGIGEGHWLFIRKADEKGKEKVYEMKEEDSNLRRPSRKRKERAEERVGSTSVKRKSASSPSNDSAAVDKVSSNLGNLSSNAATAARSISKLLGGDRWKTQSIGKLGSIQTRGGGCLQVLLKLVKTSLEIPQLSKSESSGLFSSDLVEALTRAYHQRTSSCSGRSGDHHFWELGLSDYERAIVLLKGKIEQDGSWERTGISHLDKSSLSTPASRFPLSDSGLSGQFLTATRAICACWNNDKWINQRPLPGLSPISLKDLSRNAILRQIAESTRVTPGETTPDGFPPIVLAALRESIEKNKEAFDSNNRGSKGGWAQMRNLKDALALLKERPAVREATPSFITGSSSNASESRADEEGRVRRRLDGGK